MGSYRWFLLVLVEDSGFIFRIVGIPERRSGHVDFVSFEFVINGAGWGKEKMCVCV